MNLHLLLSLVDLSDLFEQRFKILDYSAVIHKNLPPDGCEDHGRGAWLAQCLPDFRLLIREQGEWHLKFRFEGLHLFFAVTNSYPYDFNVFRKSRVFLDPIVEPVNYRRVLRAVGSESPDEFNQDEF
jgi:hypothetical protein